MLTSADLKKIVTEARPLIEQQLDLSEQIAGLREVVTAAGGDWSQLKALVKAQIQDERDEAGDGKRVRKILDKADYATAYADMLGLANMNEKNSFAASDEQGNRDLDAWLEKVVDHVDPGLLRTIIDGSQTEAGRRVIMAAIAAVKAGQEEVGKTDPIDHDLETGEIIEPAHVAAAPGSAESKAALSGQFPGADTAKAKADLSVSRGGADVDRQHRAPLGITGEREPGSAKPVSAEQDLAPTPPSGAPGEDSLIAHGQEIPSTGSVSPEPPSLIGEAGADANEGGEDVAHPEDHAALREQRAPDTGGGALDNDVRDGNGLAEPASPRDAERANTKSAPSIQPAPYRTPVQQAMDEALARQAAEKADRTKVNPDCLDPAECGVQASWEFFCLQCQAVKRAREQGLTISDPAWGQA